MSRNVEMRLWGAVFAADLAGVAVLGLVDLPLPDAAFCVWVLAAVVLAVVALCRLRKLDLDGARQVARLRHPSARVHLTTAERAEWSELSDENAQWAAEALARSLAKESGR